MWVDKQEWHEMKRQLEANERRVTALSDRLRGVYVPYVSGGVEYYGRGYGQYLPFDDAINTILRHLGLRLSKVDAVPERFTVEPDMALKIKPAKQQSK
jgi:hypothetical protein